MLSLPDQEIYEKVSDVLIDNGVTWYSTLPDYKETFSKMPYVYCGDVSLQMLPNKSALQGTASITLNFYGTSDQRWEVSQLQAKMYQLLLPINRTEHYKIVADPVVTVNTITEEVIQAPRSTAYGGSSVWHGTLDLTYKIY